MCAQSLSRVQLFVAPWTTTWACQAPLSTEFSKQEYWNGLPFPTQRVFPIQGLKVSLLYLPYQQADTLPPHHLGAPRGRMDT